MSDSANRPTSGPQEAPLEGPRPSAPGGGARDGDAGARDSAASEVGDEFPYLDPPRGPDEIGWMGGYRVLSVLGRGGMGVVFVAEDPQLGRRVALKVPHVEADETFRKRFLREGRLAGTLPHDHIAAVYQAGQHRDMPFLALELLRGESLEAYLDRHKRLPVAEALRITREVAVGLRAAHAAGLIHRDVKPGNIFLETPPHGSGAPRVKILDFGVAREVQPGDQGITVEGQIVGSVGYMAPEQLVGGTLDARTDLFALGCLLYEMLFGHLPFTGDNTVEALRAVLNKEPVPAGSATEQVPPPVRALLEDLLQKNPARRPPSAEVLVRRLQDLEHDLSRPGTRMLKAPLGQTAGPARKPWGVVGGSVAVAAAVLIGLVVLYQRLSGPQGVPPTGGDPAAGVAGAAAGGDPIKVGILHSLSGPLAANEMPMAEMTLMAIDEINNAGGVLGRRLEPILEDSRSTDQGFAEGAEKLIQKDGVVTIFGCWTSSSRKAVKPVCERHDNLLVYSVNFEGLEESPNIVYVGGGPNQQLIPAAGWAVGMLGKHRFFLVGTDYLYSRAAGAILRDRLKALRADCVGEAYVPPRGARGAEFGSIVARIKESGADAILSTVDGHQPNISFFHALGEAGVQARDLPSVSFSFGETELRNLDERDVVGHYAVSNYFQSLPGPVNQEFLKRFRAKHPARVVNDTMAAAYSAAHLWKQAVAEAGSDRPPAIRAALRHQKFEGPEGPILLDPATQYAMRTARVGRAVSNREFRIVFASPEPMPPEPFPPTRSRAQWEAFLQGLYRGWDNHWESPSQ